MATTEQSQTFLSVALDSVNEPMSSLCVELSFLALFILGFFVFRFDLLWARLGTNAGKRKRGKENLIQDYVSSKIVTAEYAAGNMTAVLAEWESKKTLGPFEPEVLKAVAHALVEKMPDNAAEELLNHLKAFPAALKRVQNTNIILEVFAKQENVKLMEEFPRLVKQQLGISSNGQTCEILMGGYAAAGQIAKVEELVACKKHNLSAKAFSLIIKGLLKNGLLESALRYVKQMQGEGYYVPSHAICNLIRAAMEQNCVSQALDTLGDSALNADTLALLFDDCLRHENWILVRRLETDAQRLGIPLVYRSYDSLVKFYALYGNQERALELFEAFASAYAVTEGSCIGILARCAETKGLELAAKVFAYARQNMKITVALYSALMKVYAYCGLYDKACDLYEDVKADGLEPDTTMYGCLMKFAVECGRIEFSQELFKKIPQVEIQNYMSLIRAAGQRKDINKAFSILKDLKASGINLDIAAFNSVLDVCVVVGDMERAYQLMEEMKTHHKLDIITFNTMLKGYCAKGDLRGARHILQDIERSGLKPNDVSYNCMINSAVKSGHLADAWDIIKSMEKAGVVPDNYTMATMMRAVKHSKSPRDVERVLDLLDRCQLDVCKDEVLLNNVLDTCIRQHEHERLKGFLALYESSQARPNVHIYGTLIKAYGALKNIKRCRELWQEVSRGARGVVPSEIVVGCMLDALVNNGEPEEAVQVMREWQKEHTANNIMYSCILKGFVAQNNVERTSELYEEMKANGVQMNSITFNVLIDANARHGGMDKVVTLLEEMHAHGVKPDSVTNSTVIKGYCVQGQIEKALEVFRGMNDHDIRASGIVFNTLIDGCVKNNRFDMADTLLAEMEAKHVPPSNFTLTMIVKMWGRRRNLDKALETVQHLTKKYNFQPNLHVSTCLITTCLNNGSPSKALEIFAKIQDKDAKTYSSLIMGLVRHGQAEQAVPLIEEAYGLLPGRPGLPSGARLEAEAMEGLFQSLVQKGFGETVAVPLLDKLRTAKVPMDQKLYAMSVQSVVRQSIQQKKPRGEPSHPWRR